MNPPTTPAAAVCVACNNEPAEFGSMIGAACRQRMAAAAAATQATREAAERAAATAAQAERVPAKKAKPAVSNRLAADLDTLVSLPAALAGTPGSANYAAAKAADTTARRRTCHQCGNGYGVESDKDDTPGRCGDCVRANRAALRNWRDGR